MKNSKTLMALATAGIIAGFSAPPAWAGDHAAGTTPAGAEAKSNCAGKSGCNGTKAVAPAEKAKNSCSAKSSCNSKSSCNASSSSAPAEHHE